MKLIINIDEDIVTARIGDYEASVKADMPDDPKDIIETLLSEHILHDVLEELHNEIY